VLPGLLFSSLRKHGVEDEVIASAMAEVHEAVQLHERILIELSQSSNPVGVE